MEEVESPVDTVSPSVDPFAWGETPGKPLTESETEDGELPTEDVPRQDPRANREVAKETEGGETQSHPKPRTGNQSNKISETPPHTHRGRAENAPRAWMTTHHLITTTFSPIREGRSLDETGTVSWMPTWTPQKGNTVCGKGLPRSIRQ